MRTTRTHAVVALPAPGGRAFRADLPQSFRTLATLLLAALLLAAGRLLFAEEGVTPTLSGAAVPLSAAPTLQPVRLAWAIGAILLLTLISAFFAMAEIALITVRKTRIRQLVEEGNRSARLIERMLEQPTRLQATLQTGVTLVFTFSTVIAAEVAIGPLAHWLSLRGAHVVAGSAVSLALILVALPVAMLSLVVGQIAPKSLAVGRSERLALLAAHPIYWLQILLRPIVATLQFLANLIVKPLGGTAGFITPAVNEEELKMLVEAGEEQGVLEADETEMIHSILNLGDTVVRKVMTPRIDLTALDVDAPLSELIRVIGESGHSRIPVYRDNLDDIVGIVHAKDILKLPMEDRDSVPIEAVMRPPYFIPETKKVDDLLAEFRRGRQQPAIVRDEYGVTSGGVTIEDLLEEIVGDIQDEYDVEEPPIQVIDATTTLIDGKTPLGDVNERMDLDLPEEEGIDTLGGFVFGLLGHQAAQGERVRWHNVEFVVDATDGRRITKVRVIKLPHLIVTQGERPAFDAALPNADETLSSRAGTGS